MAGPIRIAILAQGRQAKTEINSVNSSLTRLGGIAKKVGVAGGLGLLAVGAARFAKSAVDAEAKFSTTMRLIQASTKATAAEMEQLNSLAIDLGAKTTFSAGEAADAMLELAKAGLDTKTIMGGGVAGTLTLAAAGGVELGQAATIASNALNTFNLRGKDMASVAAALAGGANASSASVESLGQALSQVGPGATNAGLSLQETVAALSAFDAAGIKGSDAGTSLKTMLARLVPTTTKASKAMEQLGLDFVKGNGEFDNLSTIAQELQQRLGKLAPAQRQVALNTIFGSDASRAATVLMKEGSAGLKEFIRATNDQSAAQKMANARMSGTAGTLERINGAVETAKLRIGQELAPLVQKAGDAFADNLVPGIEAGIKAGKALADALEPAVSAIADAFKELLPSAEGTGSIFYDVLIPAVRTLSELVATLLGPIESLPEPLKSIAVQGALAALVFPKLASGLTAFGGGITTNVARLKQLNAEMTYTATRTQRVSALMTQLGTATRGVAGVGGMVALTNSAKQSNTALQTLGNIGGGALLGFAVGGPIGAAVGAGAGGLLSLYQATQKTSDAMGPAAAKADAMAASIDAIAAASGKAQRAEALRLLQTEGMIGVANQLGISTQTMIAALLGNSKAAAAVRREYEGTTDVLRGLQAQKLTKFLTDQGFALRLSRNEIEENRKALQKWDGKLRTTGGAVGDANKKIKGLGNVNPSSKWLDMYGVDLQAAGRKSQTEPNRWNELIRSGTGRARANLAPLSASLSSQLSSLKATASSGGSQIGSALGSGIKSGVDAWIGNIAASAAAAVQAALDAARARADARSPSRKMIKLGHDLGDGLVVGMRQREGKASKGGQRLIDQVVKAAGQGSSNLAALITKELKARDLKDKRIKQILRSLKAETKALMANQAAQTAVNQKLEQARGKYADLVRASKDYAATIRTSFVEYGNITGLGKNDEGTASTFGVVEGLKAQVRDAKRFADLIRKLAAAKLNATSLQQLLAAGVEGGLSTAEALVAGGSATITEINKLTAELTAAGGSLGDQMADKFHSAGIKAAAGLVDGLEAQAKRLDKVATRLADALVDAIKKKLKIKSPSRVFQQLGEQSVKGLAIGLDETYVKRQGTLLATSLTQGFARPDLAADVTVASAGQAGRPPVQINIKVDAGVGANGAEIGRQVAGALDDYFKGGGAKKVAW